MTMSPERSLAVSQLIASIDARRNLVLGIAAGLAGALLGAVLWAAITVNVHAQIGFMAIGVAYLVGLGMSHLGNGRTKIFGYWGAALAIFGSVLGNVLTIYATIATGEDVPLARLVAIPPATIERLFQQNFNLIDVLFYGIAASYGYRSSIRHLTKAEIAALPA